MGMYTPTLRIKTQKTQNKIDGWYKNIRVKKNPKSF